MDRETFDDYIRRFNAEDPTAFHDYIHPDLRMVNGTLEFRGVQAMLDHYAKIWGNFTEELHVQHFVSDADTVAIQMWAHFTALADAEESLFGPVRKDETFDFNGLIMYWLANGRFAEIKVAYNSFVFTDVNGTAKNLGIPH